MNFWEEPPKPAWEWWVVPLIRVRKALPGEMEAAKARGELVGDSSETNERIKGKPNDRTH